MGIDVIQLDDPALTYFCDRRLMTGEDIHDERLRRNWDIDRQFPQALAAINRIAEGLSAEVHLHCCHSVYKRQSDVVGDYKPILPRLSGARVDRVNLEFVDVRTEKLQSVEQIETIAAAGAAIISPERIALNPDCGFAPDAGEPPSIDEAYEKLSRLVTAASRLRARFDRDNGSSSPVLQCGEAIHCCRVQRNKLCYYEQHNELCYYKRVLEG